MANGQFINDVLIEGHVNTVVLFFETESCDR